MTGFGILGYLMRKTNFVPAAMLLGVILGPIAEDGFRRKRAVQIEVLSMAALVMLYGPSVHTGPTIQDQE